METNTNLEGRTSVTQVPNASSGNSEGSITDMLLKCLVRWPWFIVSIVLFVSVAYFHVKRQEPVYQRDAAILIKSESRGGGLRGANITLGADMGLFDNSSNVEDEMAAITSPTTVVEVVNRLKLYMNYKRPGRFHDVTLYGKNLPIAVDMLEVHPDSAAYLEVVLTKNGQVELTHFMKRGTEDFSVCKGKVDDVINTPIGKVRVEATPAYAQLDLEQDVVIKVTHISTESAIGIFSSRLRTQLASKQSSIIEMAYSDVSVQRADDCLKTLISVYNEMWLSDRNKMAISTSSFINERLLILEHELDTVDSRISNYKSSNLIPDLEAQSGLSLTNADLAEKAVVETANKIAILKFLKEHVEKDDGTQLIPANTGIGVTSIEQQIAEYNKTMLNRNRIVANSSESNPIVQEMNQELTYLRGAILSSIKNQIKAFNSELASTRQLHEKSRRSLASNPQQNKHLLSISRQQGVKEALYLFLLQKREENELSQAFTATNTRIIQEPSGSSVPTAPQGMKILMIAFVIALAVPFGIIYLVDILDNTVRGRRDVESLMTPFSGEIPQLSRRRGGFYRRVFNLVNRIRLIFTGKKKGLYSSDMIQLDVKPNSHNVINEAFRVVRGNLEFMNSKDTKVFLITSANPGSGKTYISLNLAASFAVKKKRVLLVDLDLRKRSLSRRDKHEKQLGISDYLAGHADSYHELIQKDYQPCLDLLRAGSMPPNPSEVLYSDRLGTMLQELRNEYDYIILDCPPVEVVTDVAIIAPYVDRTIFVVRAGVMLRSMLPEIDKMYVTKRFGEMCVLLNGTEGGGGRYGYSRYSYNYGYSYGYSYE